MNKPTVCHETCTVELWPEEGQMRTWNWKHNIRGVLDRGGVLTAASEDEASALLTALIEKHHADFIDDLMAQQREREDYIAKVEAKLL